MKRVVTVLTIAGSDCSGGAGLQADIKTISALGGYAASVVTAVTVQNTRGVESFVPMSADVVAAQIRAVIDDLQPLAIKTGMLPNKEVMTAVADELAKHPEIPLIADPVMVATSGDRLMDENAVNCFVERIYPLATLITPNVPEAEVLKAKLGIDDVPHAPAWLLKGGHREGETKSDELHWSGGVKTFVNQTVLTPNTHGTGCTLSAAIATMLAMGNKLDVAVEKAISYLHHAIVAASGLCYGGGHGPENHFFAPKPMTVRNTFTGNVQFISHSNGKLSDLEGIEKALAGGCRWVQLRMKDASDDEVVVAGRKAAEMCRKASAVLIIDDRVSLVEAIGAHGVHLGKKDMPVAEARKLLGVGKIIGGTANTMADVRNLAAQGADYIGCGPFRFTTTKKGLAPVLGLDGYRRIMGEMRREGIDIPLVAIGGIVADDLAELMSTGIDGVAVSGSVLNAADPTEAMNEIINKINNRRK